MMSADKESGDSLGTLRKSTTPSGDSGKLCSARKKGKLPYSSGMGEFRARYGESVPQCQTTALPITNERLQETTRRWDGQASGGTDGWRRVEWKQLTPDMLEHLAELHTCIEEKAVALSWRELSQVDACPEDALFAPVATIPKDDNCQPDPLDLRPITVTYLIYASWASTRFRDLRAWIVRWVDESVVGGTEGKQVEEAVWPLIMELESAAESDMTVSAAAFDASKFFDHMEWDTTFGILRELGMLAYGF